MVIFFLGIDYINLRVKNDLFLSRKLIIDSVEIKLFLCFVVLTFVSGLRGGNVGTDTNSYLNIFLISNGLQNGHIRIEFLFYALNRIVGIFTDNPQWILLVSSAIISFNILSFIKNNSNDVCLSVFLYVCLFYYLASFNVMRQYIAISIILYSIKYIKDERFLPFLVSVIVAMGFHRMAIVGIFLWFIFKSNVSIKRVILCGIILIGGIISFPLVFTIIKIIWKDLFFYYVNEEIGYAGGWMMPVVYTCIFIAAFVVVVFDKEWQQNDNNLSLFTCSLISMIWGFSPFVIRGLSATSIQRIGWLYQIFSIALIPNLLDSRFFKNKKFLVRSIVVLFGLVHLIYFLSVGEHGLHNVNPYYINI